MATRDDFYTYAIAGLEAEIARLQRMLADLRKGRRQLSAPSESATRVNDKPGRPRRTKRKFTKAQRAEISERMQRYWARRKKR